MALRGVVPKPPNPDPWLRSMPERGLWALGLLLLAGLTDACSDAGPVSSDTPDLPGSVASGGSATGGVSPGDSTSGGGAAVATGGGAPLGPGGSSSAGGAAGDPFEAVLGDRYDELPLFDGEPPRYRPDAPAETVDGSGHVGNVSLPSLRRYRFTRGASPARAYLVFPGGAYFILNFRAHADDLAEQLGPEGIAVFALKYRVGQGAFDAPAAALLDAKRAVRLIRENAERFGVDPDQLGVIGYSAGSHLALRLVETADGGDPDSDDPVERRSARPSFVGSMMTWAFRAAESPFAFPPDLPPAFFCHAANDGEAPIALARAVAGQFEAAGASVYRDFFDAGAHEVCHVGDPNAPGRAWPGKMTSFLAGSL